MLLLKKGGETVYFGDLGDRALTMINYFEQNGARKCEPHENPYVRTHLFVISHPYITSARRAEYMLDVIGAGATATSAQDWHAIWKASPVYTAALEEIANIINTASKRPAVRTELQTEFATSWLFQYKQLVAREYRNYWRNPTYLIAKLVLNVICGLFIGLTFFKSKDTQQGTQNKLFVRPCIISRLSHILNHTLPTRHFLWSRSSVFHPPAS